MKYHVEKSIEINKSTEEVVPLVADFNNWNKWSPWTVAEPGCKVEISGGVGEVGHSMFWSGEIIGSGKNTLIKKEGNKYFYDLEFLKPFKSKAKTNIVLDSVGGGAKVTWTMDASISIFLFFMVKVMKNWIGMDFERGLKMMKAVAEEGSVKAETINNGVVDVEGFTYVGIKRTVDFANIGPVMSKDFSALEEFVKKNQSNAKHWICVYQKMDMKNMKMTYVAAISDENLKDVKLGLEYVRGEIKKGKSLEIKHNGSYDFLGNAWSMGMMYLRAKKMKKAGFPYEYYFNNPKEVAKEELKTSVFFPIK